MAVTSKPIIVWLRNDLRLRDHPALWEACQAAAAVVPLFIWNDGLLYGKHASSNRNRFLLESLADLRASLRRLDGDLVLRNGDAASALLEVARQVGATDIYYTIDYTPQARRRDKLVTDSLQAQGMKLRGFPGKLAIDSFQGLVTANSGQTFKVFTPFWKRWAGLDRRQVHGEPKAVHLPKKLAAGPLPKLTDLTDTAELSPDSLPGGATAGRQRLHDFLNGPIDGYHDDHNILTPQGGTSQLSPYLKFGCLSVREIETMLPDGAGPAAFHRQLAWRDFYNYVLFHYPSNATEEFQERYRDLDWNDDPQLLKAWQQGRTGYPIIDAAMRQLLREGWMHNRSRLIVGSFLTKDLGLDWRAGESWFMRLLVDGDQSNNNGNWQWIASVGVDPAPAFRRMYNPSVQQKRHDPDGSYVRFYVPELKAVPDKYIAEPWKMNAEQQRTANCILGQCYPLPVVDHPQARRQALERYRKPPISG